MRLRTLMVGFLGVILVLSSGCAPGPSSSSPGYTDSTPNPERDVRIHGFTPEQLGKLGAAIYRHPDRTEELLERNDLTRRQFEDAIRRVTSQADLARRYQQAFEEQLQQ